MPDFKGNMDCLLVVWEIIWLSSCFSSCCSLSCWRKSIDFDKYEEPNFLFFRLILGEVFKSLSELAKFTLYFPKYVVFAA